MARANGFQRAVSKPCFELWLLLHFRESPGPQHRAALSRLLRDGPLPGYDKGVLFDRLAEGVSAAETRAARLDREAADMGEPGRDPSTGLYRLTSAIARGAQGGRAGTSPPLSPPASPPAPRPPPSPSPGSAR